MDAYRKLCFALAAALLMASPCAALIWHSERVDAPGTVGTYTSLDLDSANEPHIAYYDATNRNLKYAFRVGKKWTIDTVDSAGNVGKWCSLALDKDDVPHISYYDATKKTLKYARWNGSSWARETVHKDSGDDVGQFTSIAVDSSKHPHISYYHASNSKLYYANWIGSRWDIDRVDAGDVGKHTSIALENDGTPHISYYDVGDGELRHAWNSGTWSDELVDDDGNVGRFTSIVISNSGSPRISYYDVTNRALKLASKSGSTWTDETVDSSAAMGLGTSLDIDASNRSHIAYYNVSAKDLMYARWDGSQWDIETADSGGRVGQYPSMKLGFSNLPFISYANTRAHDLKFTTPSGPWLSWSTAKGFQDGVRPNSGTEDKRFRFRVVFQDPSSWGPTAPVALVFKDGARVRRVRLRAIDAFPDYAIGAELQGGTKLPTGTYTYKFRAKGQSGVFAGGEPTRRRGTVTVTAGSPAPILRSLAAVPTNVGAQIAVNLTSAARVDARILNIAGRPVKQLVSGREYPSGTNTLIWNGRNDSGLAAPAGAYIVVVVARTEDGRQDRAIAKVPLRR